MRWKYIGVAIVLLVMVSTETVHAAEAPAETALYAQSAVVIEAETGRIVYAKDAGATRAMASTTKIMTLLVALENADPESRVMVSANAASQPEVHMDMKVGESYRLIDLLYAMMLQSYNDTAVAIAEHVGGSVERFCEMMNERAYRIGAVNTQFMTPNGLDAEGHYSTALDMAWIMQEVLQNEMAVKIMQTPAYTIAPDEGHTRSISLVNKNPMLSVYDGTICGKTGFTSSAGLCLVNAAKRDGITLITVVLGSGWPPNSSCRVQDTRRMLQYGFEGFYMKQFELDGQDTGIEVAVHDADISAISTVVQGDFRYYVSDEDEIEIHYDLPYVMEAPVTVGSVVGEAQILVNQRVVESLPILCCEGAEKTDLEYFLKRLLLQM